LATLCGGIAHAGIEKTTQAFTPEPTQDRVFQHWGNKTGNFRGKLDSLEEYRANLIDPKTGKNLRVPLFYFSAPDMCYLLSQMALRDFPREMTHWTFSGDEKSKNRLIHVTVDDLPIGPLKEVKNTGTLGGEFVKINYPPHVREVQGRKGIFFETNKKGQFAPPKFEMMTSSFTLEDRLDQKQPFTASAWLYTQTDASVEGGRTLLSWHSIGGDHGTILNHGRECDIGGMSKTARGTKGDRKGHTGIHPADRWQHVTYTYTGGDDGVFRVYVDGEMTYETQYDSIVETPTVTKLTSESATVQAQLLAKNGTATVSCYLDKVDHKHWFQMRHWRWDQCASIAWAPEGEVQFSFEKLEPGTRYYYRIMSIDYGTDHGSYTLNPMRRWMYGPGSFVTPSEDGKTPGKTIPEDRRKHFFLGGNWGSAWYMAAQGPDVLSVLDGGIADLRLYDYAMTPLGVRLNAGFTKAAGPQPADKEKMMAQFATPRWSAAHPEATQYDVALSLDEEAVKNRSAKATRTKESSLPRFDTLPGRTYFWAVDQLDDKGNLLVAGDVWSFSAGTGIARDPNPAEGESVNTIYTLKWTGGPAPAASSQHLYVAETPEELDAMTEPLARVRPGRWGGTSEYQLNGTETVPGKTYYWRVDIAYETREPGTEPKVKGQPHHGMKPGKLLTSYIAKGDTWSFTTKPYFTPERDIPSSLPNLDSNQSAGRGAKIVKLDFGPGAVASMGSDQDMMLHKVIATTEMYGKNRYLLALAAQRNIASTLTSYEGSGKPFFRGFGTGQSYGGVESKDLLLVHEMGHEVFNLLGFGVPGYFSLIEDIWLGTADTNIGLAGYNANNYHENMAVFMQAFGDPARREAMFSNNYRQAVALTDYLPGDRMVDLDANTDVETDASGHVTKWNNNAWIKAWNGTTARLYPRPGTKGSFLPYGGKPTLTTVAGVSAVSFDGTTAFKWDEKIKWNLSRNLPFSIEYWVYQAADASGSAEQLIAGWGEKDDNGTGFYLNRDGTIYDHGQKKTARLNLPKGHWNHVIQVYKGPGEEGSIDTGVGLYRVYVNGILEHETPMTFSIPQKQSIYVGGRVDARGKVSDGLLGALASVKIYDYDLTEYQVRRFYSMQLPSFTRDDLAVADKLFIDLDARLLADTQKRYHQPTYPKRLRKPWLRSWSNKGILGGRVHNDIHATTWGYSGSTPVLRKKLGGKIPTFDGMDRMVSGFEPTAELIRNAPGTLELWLDNQAENPGEVILQWGDFLLTADNLPKGQQAVTVVFDGPANVYVNGSPIKKTVGALAPKANQRMHLGGRYDDIRWNWKDYFNGSIAAVRLHKGKLTPEQIAANATSHVFAKGGSGVVPPARKTPPALIALQAEALPPGKLDEWKNTGSAKVDFVAGKRGDIFGLTGMVFNKVHAIKMTPGRTLTATFDTPEALKKGPFTLNVQIVDEVSQRRGPRVLSWCGDGAAFDYGVQLPQDAIAFTAHSLDAQKKQVKVAFSRAPKRETHYNIREDNDFNPHMAYMWRNVSLVYDGKMLKYYVDGRMTNEMECDGIDIPGDGKLVIGSKQNGINYVYLHSLKILGRALSADEVQALARDHTVGDDEALVNVRVGQDVKKNQRVSMLKNTGSLKGSFATIPDVDHTPTVTTVDGLRAVEFNGKTTYMMSTAKTPATLTADCPFTVEMMIRPKKLNTKEAVFALSPQLGRVRGETYFGSPGNTGISQGVGYNRSLPKGVQADQWMHVTYVYDGGPRSQARIYINGQQVADRTTSIATLPGYSMYLGAGFGDTQGETNPFNGAIRSLTVYNYPRTAKEIQSAADKAMLTDHPLAKDEISD
jgi:hypothetical protein